MILGIEIECEVNTKLIRVSKDNYHGTHPIRIANDYWKAECDGSLRNSKFPMSDTVEFISKKLVSFNNMKTALEEFKAYFSKVKPVPVFSVFGTTPQAINSEDTELELGEILNFNNSMGCHIHFSLDKDYKFKKLMLYKGYAMARNKFFSLLKSSTIIPEDTKAGILKHYSRQYARKLKPNDVKNGYSMDRRTEFNLCSERDGRGLEWRSFNLLGITTWNEFFEMFRIAEEVIKYFDIIKKKLSQINRVKINTSLIAPLIPLSEERNITLVQIPALIDIVRVENTRFTKEEIEKVDIINEVVAIPSGSREEVIDLSL